ncbi:MAG: helical backbone metal receptor [Acidobacteriota bacterium]
MSSFLLGPGLRQTPQRVVSLVPSLTEAVFQLGCGQRLVARTDFCTSPLEVRALLSVGGTKTFEPAAVLALAPDVVLAAKEENPKARVEALAAQVPVLVADPQGPQEVPDLWRLLGSLLGAQTQGEALAREVEALLGADPYVPIPFVYFVWKDPFMAAGPDTYVSRLLTVCGFDNAVPAGPRRYPIVGKQMALADGVRVHLYPDEPYAFTLPTHLQDWGESVEEKPDHFLLDGRILCFAVSGADLTWYPSRTAAGLRLGRKLHEKCLSLLANPDHP